MNSREAEKVDRGNVVVQYDDESGDWLVQGAQTGFAYASFSSREQANDFAALRRLDSMLDAVYLGDEAL